MMLSNHALTPPFTFTVLQINAITALSYLIQALDSGVQWVRYAQWALTGPLTMVTFGLLAGASWVDIFFTVIATLLGVAAGFAGALSLGENAAWPLLGFAAACFFVVAISLLYTFRTAAYKVHGEIGKLYDVLAFSSTALYAGYVIMWGTAEGSHNATPDQSIIVYAVFDILAAAVGGLFLLLSRESIARYGSFLGSNSAEYDFSFATASATANIKA